MAIRTGGAGGGNGAGGDLVFEWNRTDITQFTGSSPDLNVGGATGAALSAAAVTDRGTALRMATNGNGATTNLVWLASSAIVFPDDRRDLLIEMEVYDGSYGAGGYAGIALAGDTAGGVHCLCHSAFGAAEWAARITAGAVLSAGATGGAIGDGGLARFYVRGERRAGDHPTIQAHVGERERFTGPTAAAGGQNQFGSGAAFGASWDGLQADRWGICLQSSGGNVAPSQVDILDLRVYRL